MIEFTCGDDGGIYDYTSIKAMLADLPSTFADNYRCKVFPGTGGTLDYSEGEINATGAVNTNNFTLEIIAMVGSPAVPNSQIRVNNPSSIVWNCSGIVSNFGLIIRNFACSACSICVYPTGSYNPWIDRFRIEGASANRAIYNPNLGVNVTNTIIDGTGNTIGNPLYQTGIATFSMFINCIIKGAGLLATSGLRLFNRCTLYDTSPSFSVNDIYSVFQNSIYVSDGDLFNTIASRTAVGNRDIYRYIPLWSNSAFYSYSAGAGKVNATDTVEDWIGSQFYSAILANGLFAVDPDLEKTGDVINYLAPKTTSPFYSTSVAALDTVIQDGNKLLPLQIGALADYSPPDFPDVGNVTTDATVNNIPGTCVLPAEADTKLSVGYGADGTEFIGSYDPLGAPPVKPGLSVVSAGDGQVTLAYTLAVETDTVYARYRTFPSGSWSEENILLSRVNSGNITVTGLTNMQNYEFSGYANAGGCDSDWADPVLKVPTDGADIYPLSEDLKDLLVNAGIGTFATVTDWQIFINTEETGPDNCITVYDTGSEVVDRVLSNGKITDKLSAQINLRSIVYQDGINKITAIQTLFENINGFTGINRDYRSIKRQQNFNYVGTDENQRFMFTLNFVVTVDDS